MRFFRRQWMSRTIALLLLLVAASGMPHGSADDPACRVPQGEQAGQPSPAIGAETTLDHEHCAICHWTRSLRSPLVAAVGSDVPLAAGLMILPGIAADRRSPDTDNLPARAPPIIPSC
jgi:hypothetical protein